MVEIGIKDVPHDVCRILDKARWVVNLPRGSIQYLLHCIGQQIPPADTDLVLVRRL